MGGNAFPRLSIQRIQRQHIEPTLKHVTDVLEFPGFTLAYARDNLMGSAGKQDNSGDLDFALNNLTPQLVGQPDLPLFDLREINERCREVLPQDQVQSRHLRGGQIQTAWPIAGNSSLGLVQVDFIAGDPQWLRFTHWSPGKDVSPWKGVMISTMLGVLAKTLKDFEAHDEQGRYARVGWHYDLERGLHRKWRLRVRDGMGLTDVDADHFETHVPEAPRVPRLGYITDPPVVLSILFGTPTEPSQVDTFEKIVQRVRQCYADRSEEIFERYLDSFARSAGRRDYTREQVSGAIRQSL